VYSAVKSIAGPFKSTLLYAQMIHIAIAGGNGPGGAAKCRIPNIFFFLKRASGARLASDRAYRRFGPKLRRDARFSRRIWHPWVQACRAKKRFFLPAFVTRIL